MDLDWVFGNKNMGPIIMFSVIFIVATFTLLFCGLHAVATYFTYRREKRRLIRANKKVN